MKDPSSVVDSEFHKWLASDRENRCFETVIPRSTAMQYAASFVADKRSYMAKYPGDAGTAIRKLTKEFLARIGQNGAH
jgi:chromosome partitioning protein